MSFAHGDRVCWESTPSRLLYGTYAVAEERPGVQPDGDPDLLYLDASQLRPAIPVEDGIYPHLPSGDYHADKTALSASGAKLLLPPSCPAKFRHAIDNPPDPKPHFDFGHCAHKFVLGEGEEIVPVYADDWRTKAAQEQRKSAHAGGKVPLLAADVEKAMAMATAVHQHPIAGPLFKSGDPEVSLYATDAETGVRLRGRLDWTTHLDGRFVIADLKTAANTEPETFSRKAVDYLYHLSAAWYRELVIALGIADDPAFLLAVVEKEPPHLVTVREFDADAITEGGRLMRRAIDLYAQCTQNDTWPGYTDQITPIMLPPWALSQPTIGELLEKENA